ncbi:Chalcone isomerase [Zostera marina]|uniref:Chalcone-flavonone isomerase family protein n=1 Tax=Zostera marina TaxID=29655 RepID=A0A0K9PSQ3_ZOSMR|nr:Chalcone isomerase [Zostera marina]
MSFFMRLSSRPLEKVLKVVVIKEIKGSQYGVQLQNSVRDRLVEVDRYEEEEEEELDKLTDFFQSKYMKKDSVITFSFHGSTKTAKIGFTTEGKEESHIKIENPNVVEMVQKWYLGGERAISPTTITSLTETFAGMLQ